MAKSVKVGTKIKHTLFGGGSYEGVVKSIEKCKDGEKYGTMVSSMPLDKRSRNYVLDLDNGHWCYGNQVLSVYQVSIKSVKIEKKSEICLVVSRLFL